MVADNQVGFAITVLDEEFVIARARLGSSKGVYPENDIHLIVHRVIMLEDVAHIPAVHLNDVRGVGGLHPLIARTERHEVVRAVQGEVERVVPYGLVVVIGSHGAAGILVEDGKTIDADAAIRNSRALGIPHHGGLVAVECHGSAGCAVGKSLQFLRSSKGFAAPVYQASGRTGELRHHLRFQLAQVVVVVDVGRLVVGHEVDAAGGRGHGGCKGTGGGSRGTAGRIGQFIGLDVSQIVAVLVEQEEPHHLDGFAVRVNGTGIDGLQAGNGRRELQRHLAIGRRGAAFLPQIVFYTGCQAY